MLPPLPRCSRRAQTSLKLTRPYQPSPKWVSGRPAHRPFRGLLSVHSRCGLHTRTVTYVTVIRGLQTFRHLHACPGRFRLELLAGWDFHPLESAAFARRTPVEDIQQRIQGFQLPMLVHAESLAVQIASNLGTGSEPVGCPTLERGHHHVGGEIAAARPAAMPLFVMSRYGPPESASVQSLSSGFVLRIAASVSAPVLCPQIGPAQAG